MRYENGDKVLEVKIAADWQDEEHLDAHQPLVRKGDLTDEGDGATFCAGPPTEELVRAVDEFNRGDWFECHETLEELWVGTVGEMRDFYQGLLQLAVALYHWREGNFKGAVLLLNKSAEHLGRVRLVCQRVEVNSAVVAANRFRETLEALGPERMTEVAPPLIPRLVLRSGGT